MKNYYTQEPDEFEYQSELELNNEYEKQLDQSFKDFNENYYYEALNKGFEYRTRIENNFMKHKLVYKRVYNGYILKFKDDDEYKKFKSIYRRSKLFNTLQPLPQLGFKLPKDNTLKLIFKVK